MATLTNKKDFSRLFAGLIVIAISLGSFGGNSNFVSASVFVDEELEAKHENSLKAILVNDLMKPYMTTIPCDIAVVGGGSGGFAAALAAARMGVPTCLIEKTDWLGGMLTAAGVSGIDGHFDTASGIFREFLNRVSNYYAERETLDETNRCKVSFFCFEPHIGNLILNQMFSEQKNLKVFFNAEVQKVYREENTVLGISFKMGGKEYVMPSKVTIDATEFGDLMYLADVPFDLGVDEYSAKEDKRGLQCIQPLTYVAILKNYEKDSTIKEPMNYKAENYQCVTKNEQCKDSNSLFTKERLFTYGKLPNGKLMLNIPSHSYGNDFDASDPEFEDLSRYQIMKKAKDYTKGLIYFMQQNLGFEYYGLYNEFGTNDAFAKIPYVRESRRLVGEYRLSKEDVMPNSGRSKLFTDSIAVGDYPIDLHFCDAGYGDIFFSIPPYQIPYGVTVPFEIDGFMAVEKNISVSHLVNGTTRLQPVVMSVGQGVGVAAALAVQNDILPREVPINEIQDILLDQGSRVFYFQDVPPDHFAYKAVSELAVRGVVFGFTDQKFLPWKKIKREEFEQMLNGALANFGGKYPSFAFSDKESKMQRSELARFLAVQILGLSPDENYMMSLAEMGVVNADLSKFRPDDLSSRAEAAVMLMRVIDILEGGF
ncbi:FAD-dependent oxidoreductase [Candidatus Peregrinibacteria bacterium]|nr:FAD-dependent oxidoreductase [Candidatus Peregrinibacteria bacterium]